MESGRFIAETRLSCAELAEIFGGLRDVIAVKTESKTPSVFATDGDIEKYLGGYGPAGSSSGDGADSRTSPRSSIDRGGGAGHEGGCCFGREASGASSSRDGRCSRGHAAKARSGLKNSIAKEKGGINCKTLAIAIEKARRQVSKCISRIIGEINGGLL